MRTPRGFNIWRCEKMNTLKVQMMKSFRKFLPVLAFIISFGPMVRSQAEEPAVTKSTTTQNESVGHLKVDVRSQSTTVSGVTLTIEVPAKLVAGTENLITLRVWNQTDNRLRFLPSAVKYRGPYFEVFRKDEAIPKTTFGSRSFEPGLFVRPQNQRSSSRTKN